MNKRVTPDFFVEYLTQNVLFHVKSHNNRILKSEHPMLPNLTWNETWNDTSLKELGDYHLRLSDSIHRSVLKTHKKLNGSFIYSTFHIRVTF